MLHVSREITHSHLTPVKDAVNERAREVGLLQGTQDGFRPITPPDKFRGFPQLGQEGVVFVRVQQVLIGVRVRSVEFILLNECYMAFFLAAREVKDMNLKGKVAPLGILGSMLQLFSL